MLFETPIPLLAPVYAGWVYDTTGSYISALVLFVVLTGFSMFLVCLVRPPKPLAITTNVMGFD